MKLNHLDLRVSDVRAFAAFLVNNFDFVVTKNRDSDVAVFLDDGHGFSLVLQRADGVVEYPEAFHLGFLVDAPDAVHRARERLAAAGVAVGEVVENGRGTLLYFHGPEGMLFEVSSPRRRAVSV